MLRMRNRSSLLTGWVQRHRYPRRDAAVVGTRRRSRRRRAKLLCNCMSLRSDVPRHKGLRAGRKHDQNICEQKALNALNSW